MKRRTEISDLIFILLAVWSFATNTTITKATTADMFTYSADGDPSASYSRNVSTMQYLPTVSNETARVNETKAIFRNVQSATARLKAYIRNLPVAVEKVSPFPNGITGTAKSKLELSFAVLTIYGMDITRQTVTTGSYMKLSWLDESLAWNPDDYCNVSVVDVSSDVIWTPRVVIINSVNLQDVLSGVSTLRLNSSGGVYVQVPLFLDTACSLDLTDFPFDEQFCPVILHAFAENVDWRFVKDIDIKSLADFLDLSSEWNLVSVEEDLLFLHGDLEPKFVLRLKRKTTYYTVFLVFPMVMTSYVNVLIFVVPAESGEKLSYLVTVFVSTSVYLSFFFDLMPRGLDIIPSSIYHLLFVIIQSLCVLVATIFILRRFQQEKKQTLEHPGANCQGNERSNTLPLKETTVSQQSFQPTSNRTNIVTPSPVSEKQNGEDMGEQQYERVIGRCPRRRKLTVEELDRWCFVVGIVGSVVVQTCLLVYTLYS